MEPIIWQRETSVPAEKAREWYFDLQEDDHMSRRHKPLYRGKGAPRKLLSREKDRIVVEDDYGGGPPTTVIVTLAGTDRIEYVFDSNMYHSESAMTFTPKGNGSILMTEARPGWKGFGKLVGFFWGRKFGQLIQKDLDAHAQEMEDAWKAKPW